MEDLMKHLYLFLLSCLTAQAVLGSDRAVPQLEQTLANLTVTNHKIEGILRKSPSLEHQESSERQYIIITSQDSFIDLLENHHQEVMQIIAKDKTKSDRLIGYLETCTTAQERAIRALKQTNQSPQPSITLNTTESRLKLITSMLENPIVLKITVTGLCTFIVICASKNPAVQSFLDAMEKANRITDFVLPRMMQ